jgi:hypothetical protein
MSRKSHNVIETSQESFAVATYADGTSEVIYDASGTFVPQLTDTLEYAATYLDRGPDVRGLRGGVLCVEVALKSAPSVYLARFMWNGS